MRILIRFIVAAIILVPSIQAQIATGGDYTLEQAVIAGGGGTSTDTVNSVYTIEGTAGQPNAGDNSSGTPYNLKSGFWTPPFFAPTAANASISGRVLRENGRGLGGVRVILEGGNLTAPRVAVSSPLGYFQFEDVATGQTYVVSVRHKRYGFGEPSHVLNLMNDVTGIVFQATWSN
jgi:hypothetical protein